MEFKKSIVVSVSKSGSTQGQIMLRVDHTWEAIVLRVSEENRLKLIEALQNKTDVKLEVK